MATYDFSAAFASSFASIGGTQDDQTLLDLLKLFLGIPPEDTENDEALIRAINFAGDMMETYLDRIIAKRETSEFFPHHFGTVTLHHLPVEDPVTVKLNGEDDAADWGWYKDRGGLAHLSRINSAFDVPMDWRKFDNVEVIYTAGFDPIPSDLAYAINLVAAGIYAAEGTGQAPGGSSGDVKKQTIVGVGSIEYDVGSASSGGTIGLSGAWGPIPASAAQLVSKYKRMAA